jgi:hypothetical protein
MFDAFLWLFDRIAWRQKQSERERKRNVIPPDVDPDEVEVRVESSTKTPPHLACRVCGELGRDRFCLRCLAETMEPVARHRR